MRFESSILCHQGTDLKARYGFLFCLMSSDTLNYYQNAVNFQILIPATTNAILLLGVYISYLLLGNKSKKKKINCSKTTNSTSLFTRVRNSGAAWLGLQAHEVLS